MPSRIDEAGHTKAFDFPVAENSGESRNVQFRGFKCEFRCGGIRAYYNAVIRTDFCEGPIKTS